MAVSNLTMCTFNMGLGLDDHRRFVAYSKGERLQAGLHGKLDRLEGQALRNAENLYARAESYTAQKLETQFQVYFFQEIVHKNRPLIKSLEKKNFQIIHTKNLKIEGKKKVRAIGTAIALDTTRFSNIVNHSFTMTKLKNKNNQTITKDVAIVSATDIRTQERVIFASIHAPGCDLSQEAVDPNDARCGDEYCKRVAHKIDIVAKQQRAAIKIVAGDMNVNPEMWKQRFDYFNGFQVQRTHLPTNVNPTYDNHQARELDYFLVSTNNNQHRTQIVEHNRNLKNLENGSLTVDQHSSDHFPVTLGVMLKTAKQPHQLSAPHPAKKIKTGSSHKKRVLSPSRSKHISSNRKQRGPSNRKPAPIPKKESIFRRMWQTLKSCLCFCFTAKKP